MNHHSGSPSQDPQEVSAVGSRGCWTRRKFLGSTAGTLALAGAGTRAQTTTRPSRILGANERIHMGIIGTGDMGRRRIVSMLDNFKDVEFIAICDIPNEDYHEVCLPLMNCDSNQAHKKSLVAGRRARGGLPIHVGCDQAKR